MDFKDTYPEKIHYSGESPEYIIMSTVSSGGAAAVVSMDEKEMLEHMRTLMIEQDTAGTEYGPYDPYEYYDYNYTYNYTESMTHLPLDEFVPTVTIYSIIGLLGLIGNLLVIFSIARVKRMRSITNLFLLSLASADLLLVCICIPVRCIAFYSYTWRLGEFMCKSVNYFQTVSMICSALTLTAMSIERFIAIRYPLRARSLCTKRHARIVIVSTWVASFLAAIPMLFAIVHREVGKLSMEFKAYWCHKYFLEKVVFGRVFELYMLIIILAIPFLVMFITYTWIANIIWHVASRRADMRSGSCISDGSGEKPALPNGTVVVGQGKTVLHNGTMVPLTSPLPVDTSTKAYMDDDKTRKQVVMMLVTVVILFAICWTPILINNVLVAFDILDWLNMGYLKHMRIAFHILAYANSCVNPFVYAFMSKNFRDGFKQSVCACIRGDAYMKRMKMNARSVTSSTRASHSQTERINHSIALRRPSEF